MCGIVGVFSKNNKNVIPEALEALLKLQHRGQDSAGICFVQNDELKLFKSPGLVKNALKDARNFNSPIAILHTRYSTKGDLNIQNAQPFLYKNVSLCHNGTIFDVEKFKKILLKKGFNLESDSDSEIILKWLFCKLKKPPESWTADEIKQILEADFKNGSYSLLILFKDRLIALKDRFSYRPLIFIETFDKFYFLSEDCAFDAPFTKKIELNGACAFEINKKGVLKIDPKPKNSRFCVFEPVYFSSFKSNVFGVDVKETRIKLGKILAKNDNIEADYVVPMMNSGFFGAVGYSKEKNIKLKVLIKTKPEILRTFIEKKETREKKLEKKFILKKEELKGKNIVLVDDSIVRGNTSKKIISLLKKAGVKKIHLRLTSPMIKSPCFWGVDIPDENELLAYKLKTEDNIKKELEIESIKFLSNFDFENVFDKKKWCHNCVQLQANRRGC